MCTEPLPWTDYGPLNGSNNRVALYLGMSFALRDHKIFNLKILMLTQNFL